MSARIPLEELVTGMIKAFDRMRALQAECGLAERQYEALSEYFIQNYGTLQDSDGRVIRAGTEIVVSGNRMLRQNGRFIWISKASILVIGSGLRLPAPADAFNAGVDDNHEGSTPD